VRRIVTGVDDDGRSHIAHDDEIAEPTFGAKIWQNAPGDVRPWIDAIGAQPVPVQPPDGGSLALWIRILPESSTETPPPQIGVDADGFHVTRTVDYVLVQSGEVELLLDRNKVTVGAGSLVVQRATRHAWRNRSDEPAFLLAILTTVPMDGATAAES
jgi:hypothetical protein